MILIIINFIYTSFPEKKLCSRVFTKIITVGFKQLLKLLVIQTKNNMNDHK